MFDEGIYQAEALSWGYQETTSGFDQFEMAFRVLGAVDPNHPEDPPRACEPAVRSWSITLKDEANIAWLAEVVLGLGYDREDLLGLDPDLDGAVDFSGVKFLARCKHRDYQGQPREQWSVYQRRRKALEKKRVRELNERHGHVVRDVKARKAARTESQAAAPAGDIPF
jgi:hypothetical protein